MTEEKETDVATKTNGENTKNDSCVDENEVDNAIIRQVEYYFSDVNLPRDKFLREQVKLDDGWIPIEVLTTFNRLAKLSKDVNVIAKALNNSTSGLLEVSEDNKKVRRSPEMPIPEMNEERRKELMSRTIYAKGFPKHSVLDDLLKFFKQYEEVENVLMRRYLDSHTKARHFKGSVFATFKTKEQAEKFVNSKPVKYNDTELLIHWQEEYVKLKQEEFAAKKAKKEQKKEKDAEAKADKEELKLPTGTVLHFSEGDDKMTREDVKEALGALGADIAFIDFKVGDSEGWVRLTKENAAKEVSEKITDGKIKINEKSVVFRVLQDEEEKAYLKKTVEEMVKRRKNQHNHHKQNKGKHFKGKQGQGRKRKQEQSDDGPPSKTKVSS
ncbi:la protein homolog [Galleria mellonella]|uniref:La protein homolog n=1 Tax=Galleria mellonella TaxID=7137 RepID=A0A6J1WVV7_GALME|nr:la protein homolog [Galleria mellonella]XP_026756948.2 la protein homolog [Galleria mellonella]